MDVSNSRSISGISATRVPIASASSSLPIPSQPFACAVSG
jgi:hypothetical protein